MRWLVRLRGDDERHLADLEEGEQDNPSPRDGHTACGKSGHLLPERPMAHISGDELAAAAFGLCPRCLSRHG